MIKIFLKLNLRGRILFILSYLIIVVIMSFAMLKIDNHIRKKETIKLLNEMVQRGELTKEQGKAFEWVLFEYKPKK